RDRLPVTEIGFTGGEPFMNPEIIEMLDDALARGFSVLVLTNAMQPMLRPRILSGLAALRDTYGSRLVLRVSLDDYTKRLHEEERGEGTFDKTVEGIDWLARQSFTIALAGRTCWGESEEDERAGYAVLIAARGWPVDAYDRTSLVLFPEMDLRAEVPEITESCWGILHKDPRDVMCASSRMVVKRKGAAMPMVLPCTLLPYDPAFEMGATLAEAAQADGGMFEHGTVKLCHPHCAKFCVLGGGSCSAKSALLEVLAELQSLRLVMRADAVAVDLVGDDGELVIDQAPDDLSILQNERDIKAAHFEYSLRSWRLALGVAKAGVEEARIVHAILSDQGIEWRHLGDRGRRHRHALLGGEYVKLVWV